MDSRLFGVYCTLVFPKYTDLLKGNVQIYKEYFFFQYFQGHMHFRYCNIGQYRLGDTCWGPGETARRVVPSSKKNNQEARVMSYAWGHTGNRHMSPTCHVPSMSWPHLSQPAPHGSVCKRVGRVPCRFSVASSLINFPFYICSAFARYIGPLHFPIHDHFFQIHCFRHRLNEPEDPYIVQRLILFCWVQYSFAGSNIVLLRPI
jgi:hypothetical protein